MLKKVIFKCNVQPNQLTLHSLLATIFNNSHQNNADVIYKIFYKDKEITLIIEDTHLNGEKINSNYVFQHKMNNSYIAIQLSKVSEEEFFYPKHKKNEIVKVYGVIHYSINKGKKKFIRQYGDETQKITNICPIDQHGNFIENTRQHTFNYLQKKTGLNLLHERFQREQHFKYINPLEFNNHFDKSNKIHFHNAFYVNLEGFIENEDVLNKLYYCSIAQKRSYGLGNLFIQGYNE